MEFNRRPDIEVTRVNNLQHAIYRASKEKFDLCITDGSYPLSPGGANVRGAYKELCKKLGTISPHTKIVVVTASPTLQDEALRNGMEAHFKRSTGIYYVIEQYVERSRTSSNPLL